jgi:hypothetical protein
MLLRLNFDYCKKKLMPYSTLYIDCMVVFDKIRTLRYNGEGESVFHLMFLSMFCRLDPLLNALLCNSYGIVNLLMEGRVCMCKVDSSKACIGNDFY